MTFVSGSAVATPGGDYFSVTIPAPASLAVGNLLVAFAYSADSGFADGPPHTTPDGWQSLAWSNTNDPAGATTVFTKTVTASEPASYTFSGVNDWASGAILQFTPCGLDGIVAFNPVGSSGTTAATAPGHTPVFTGDLIVVVYGSWLGDSFTTPTGFTAGPQARDAGNESIYTFYRTLSSTAATGPIASTQSGASTYTGMSLLLTASGRLAFDTAPTVDVANFDVTTAGGTRHASRTGPDLARAADLADANVSTVLHGAAAADAARAADLASGDVTTAGGAHLLARSSADTASAVDAATAGIATGPMIASPRPALAGPGPSQIATAVGAGGIGGGTEAVLRITAWDCEVADEGSSKLTFTLALPPPGKAPTPPTLYFPQLIAQLQQQAGSTASTVPAIPGTGGGGGGGTGITFITSLDGTVIITNPGGPTVDLSAPDVEPGGGLIGETNPSSGSNSNTAFGYGALGLLTPGTSESVSGTGNTAIGWQALVNMTSGGTASDNTAIGQTALSSITATNGNTAIGNNAGPLAGQSNTVCVGAGARVYSDEAVAIGAVAQVGHFGPGSICIGYNAVAAGASASVSDPGPFCSVAIGWGNVVTNTANGIAIGTGAFVNNNTSVNFYGESIAIGYSAHAEQGWTIAIGDSARAGATSFAPGQGSIAIGYHAVTFGYQNIAIGAGAVGPGSGGLAQTGAVAVGPNAHADLNGAVAVGPSALSTADGVALGPAQANGASSVAIGYNAAADGSQSVAIGVQAHAALNGSVSLGTWTTNPSTGAVIVGTRVAIGQATSAEFPTIFGSGLYLSKGTGPMSSAPSGGGVLSVTAAGGLQWQGSAGTVTAIAPP